MAAAFALYVLCALVMYRWSAKHTSHRLLFGLLWTGVLGAGIASLATPGILATDVYSYASYGRLLLVHHVNPYFVPPAAYPHDPIYSALYWTHTVTVYGPLWTLISGPLSLGSTHASYILSFRAFAFAMHLLNILLVTATLRTMGRSPRVVLLGTLLYAWNPLVLSESALGAHNDVFMVTFLLLGLFLSARAERNDITRFRAYAPPLIAFTLAALVKFSALPAIPIFVFLLFRLTLKKVAVSQGEGQPRPDYTTLPHRTSIVGARLALALAPIFALAAPLCFALLISAGVGLAAYAPFWAGHGLKAIVNSFTSQPSAVNAFNSLLFTFSVLHSAHQLPASLSLLYNRHLWNDLNIGLIVCVMLLGAIGLWRVPTTRTVALVTLATLTAFLIVTPWFFVWYVTWLIGLAVLCLPVNGQRIVRGLLAFALVFSMTALTTYYSTIIGWLLLGYHPPVTTWVVLVAFASIGLPILAFFALLICSPAIYRGRVTDVVRTRPR